MVQRLCTAAQMRALDAYAIEQVGIPGPVLMEVAGRACASAARELAAAGQRVAIVCGKGNNGGDGLVAGRHLVHAGYPVDIYLLAEPEALRGDAALQYGILCQLQIPVTAITTPEQVSEMRLDDTGLIVDAILGTGLTKAVTGLLGRAIEAINASPAPVLAVDVPSGISSDNGQVLGSAVRADLTVTFGHLKPGLLLHPGAKHAGDCRCVDIGLPPAFEFTPPSCWLVESDDLAAHFGPRPPDAHKGRFGHLLVLAGSADKPGAAALCCRAAVHAGAGLVTLAASPAVLERTVRGPVEYMGVAVADFTALSQACAGKQVLALGPGLGTAPATAELVQQAVRGVELPLVVDADGLNNLVGKLPLLAERQLPTVLTPHPGEAARLLECSTAEVQRDRLAAARRLAEASQAVVVLKGAGTVVAEPGGQSWLVAAGNPGMASGGTGDVLTGIIAALLAQGLGTTEAAWCGALLHGLAGDSACARVGQRALSAGQLIEELGPVLRRFECPGRA